MRLPETVAIDTIIATLRELPDRSARERVMAFVADWADMIETSPPTRWANCGPPRIPPQDSKLGG
jgi:hypothetical protein